VKRWFTMCLHGINRRYDAPGKNILFIILLGTMMVPFYAVMIPLFVLFKSFGWINTLKPLIVPAYFGHPFSIFLLRQFFLTIPRDLFDAAAIDGCSELTAFTRIMLPLSKPALATVAIFQFMHTWNDFVGPLLYLHTPEMRTLSLGLQAFQSVHDTEWALLMAAAVVMLLPIIILFFFTQKYFIQGIALTGMKG
jgi:multiple sugar transport system permease protein